MSPTDVLNGDEELPAGPRLRALAGELVRLQPSRTDPESYFIRKSTIVDELRRLARQVDYRPRWNGLNGSDGLGTIQKTRRTRSGSGKSSGGIPGIFAACCQFR
jgi:hypothetical protein